MPSSERSFEIDLDPDEPGLHRLRVWFRNTGHAVVAFMVQYEALVEGDWRPVIRYDTAHGRAHCDRFNPTGDQIGKHWLDQGPPHNEALTTAKEDLERSWQRYYREFLSMRKGRR